MDSGVFFSLSFFLLLVVIAPFSIYLVTCLLPRSKINIKGKYVLITGCDTGFGRATAIKLDKMGACVLATCLTKEGEQSLKSEASDKLKTFQLDVTNSKQIKDVYEEIKKEIYPDGLWGLVNNAGIICLSPIEWTSLEDFKRSANVNIWGMIDVTKTFLPLIKMSKGRVVNISSAAGRITVPLTASYSVTKYGVEAFSDALRREMQPWQIKVTILEPGRFATTICSPDFSEKELRKGWNQLSEELKNDYGEEFLEKALRMYRAPVKSKSVPVNGYARWSIDFRSGDGSVLLYGNPVLRGKTAKDLPSVAAQANSLTVPHEALIHMNESLTTYRGDFSGK